MAIHIIMHIVNLEDDKIIKIKNKKKTHTQKWK